MKQSLLAFLAMSLFSLLALSQQRAAMHYHSLVHGRDYEIAAMNMVSERLARIELLSFDEADTEVTTEVQRTTPDGLTSTLGLEVGESGDIFEGYLLEADDLDDYDGFELPGSLYRFNGNDYAFDLKVDVCYINTSSPAASLVPGQTAEQMAKTRCQSAPSLAKQVLVSIKETYPVEMDVSEFRERFGRTPVSVTISRVFSPAGLSFH